MPLAERKSAAGDAPTVPSGYAVVHGWGGVGRATAAVLRPAGVHAVDGIVPALTSGPGGRTRGAIARGMGRSYGDAAQRDGGVLVDTTALAAFEVNHAAGTVRAQAGVTLGRLLAALAPDGWVLPVVPGTQHVTIGGAIAADIHGKNHATAGTFGAHVAALGLLTASGEVREVSPERDPDLFGATVGGMGLTGVIVWASIRLRRLPGAMLSVDSDRVDSLDDALALLSAPGGEYRVAWLDLLGPVPARGIVTRAQVADAPGVRAGAATVGARVTVPERWPGGVLGPGLVRGHNAYRFRRSPRRRTAAPESYGAHMFPLDRLGAWPRLYGSAGFVQYQFVVPRGQERVLERVIVALRRSSVPCYLAVLKDFGPAAPAPLSFPLEGWTLALDMPAGVPGLGALLDACDEWVAAARGRVYLAKDGRLRPEVLAAMYPRLEEWRAIRERHDPERVWASDLAVRTGLVEDC
jgi:decaprenylphospho-beta-D-ribofuranose 2-oxidase